MAENKKRCTTGQSVADAELGDIAVRVNPRARRLIFRAVEGGFVVTVPLGATWGDVAKGLETLRPRLREAQARRSEKLIDLNYRIETEHFKLMLVEEDTQRFQARSELGAMQILCPRGTDFSVPELQVWLKKVIGEALRKNAKLVLPPRLNALSKRHGLPFHEVKINSSSSRWGSCSTRKDINLSYYLLLLPQHLIDYVLLHELTHTRVMNHGTDFWALLNRLTDGKAEFLRRELRNYRTLLL